MADYRLLAKFPNAHVPLSLEQAENLYCAAKDRYGALQTFFGLPVYQNPVGIEVEVESFSTCSIPPFYWNTAEDHSLKKQGCELISTPLRGKNIDYALHELGLIAGGNKFTFSHRTSVHVHANVSTYWASQLRALMAIYACTEQLFYSFADDARKGNSFCYPLVGSPVEVVFYKSDKEGDACTKYCAFNIQPIPRQMTVEFRHMNGTTDQKTLRRWIQLIGKLVGFVEKMNRKTCVDEILQHITQKTMGSVLIPQIWGDVGDILFSEREVERSVNNGALWAVALLTKE